MKRYQTKRSLAKIVARVIAPLLILAGLVVMGYSMLIGDPLATLALFTTDPPRNQTMTLTVPDMRRVDEVPVYDAPMNNESALHDGALHVASTGLPWQRGANVYIAGHRLGFPGTKSDQVILTDANGTRYTYEVFKKYVVEPSDLHVTQPVAGKSIVTLQTCTLPDYKQRLIVQAELKSAS